MYCRLRGGTVEPGQDGRQAVGGVAPQDQAVRQDEGARDAGEALQALDGRGGDPDVSAGAEALG